MNNFEDDKHLRENEPFHQALLQLKDKMVDNSYAQAVYASMCNMMWKQKRTFKNPFPKIYSCTWRYAGGLIAEIRDVGEDYLDWYCSGISNFRDDYNDGSIPEGHVREDVERDLNNLGWVKRPYTKLDYFIWGTRGYFYRIRRRIVEEVKENFWDFLKFFIGFLLLLCILLLSEL